MLPPVGSSCSTHPDTPASASCGRCGRAICNICVVFDRSGAASCTTCAAVTPAGGTGEIIPWERRSELGLWSAFLKTVGAALVRPHQCLGPPPPPAGIGSALLFSVICHGIGFFFAMLWQFGSMMLTIGSLGGGMMGAGEIATFVAAGLLGGPLMTLLWVFVWGLVVHVFLLMFGAASEGLTGTLRVIGYSSAAGLLNAIPVLGGLVAVIWMIVIQCVGLAYAHRTGAGRTTAAVLAPFLLCCLASAGFTVLSLSRVGGW